MAMQLVDLSDDVIDCILTSLPDFPTLYAALRTSKRPFYDVYQIRPTSIFHSVACNAAGPAYQSAFKLLPFLYGDPDFAMLESEESFLKLPVPFNRYHVKLLQEIASIVQELESLFSVKHKDKRSATSTLSYDESLRFQRAIYRVWTYISFAIKAREQCQQQLDQEEWDEDNDDVVQLPENWEQDFLDVFPTDELCEIGGAYLFLTEIFFWIHAKGGNFNGTSLDDPNTNLARREIVGRQVMSLGPGTILLHWKSLLYPYDWDGLPSLWQQCEGILTNRGLNSATQHTRILGAILSETMGTNDTCDRCQHVGGLNLWGPGNWHLFSGHFDMDPWCAGLPGNLSGNSREVRWIKAKLRDSSVYISQMFELPADTANNAYSWDKTKWYCSQCMEEFVRERLLQWAIGMKRADPGELAVDCWYGYNCRTQVHRHAHISRLNHICIPTRGDGPSSGSTPAA